MRNTLVMGLLSLAVLNAAAGAQQSSIVPQVRTKPTADNKIIAIELAGAFCNRDPGAGAGELSRGGRPRSVSGRAFRTRARVGVRQGPDQRTCREQPADLHCERHARSVFSWSAVAKARTQRRLISCCDISHPAASWSSPTPFRSHW